jgi:transposase
MWALGGNVQVHLASQPVDGRKGMHGLMGLVQTVLNADPYSGHAFVFLGRRRDLVKCLLWNRGGFVLLQKRLQEGTFKLPAMEPGQQRIELSASQFGMLLDGMDISAVPVPALWEPKRVDRSPKP